MFSPGTLVNVPHFRGKALLVVGSDVQSTRCLWSSESGEMGEVHIPTSLLREVQAAVAPVPQSAPPAAPSPSRLDETLPSDWIRKAASGVAIDS